MGGRRAVTSVLSAVLLDTHAWAWSLTDDPRLSEAARRAIGSAGVVYVSPITFYEIAQKVRLGKWPQMEPHIGSLPDLLLEQGGRAARFDPVVCTLAGTMDWAHRDPFDRLIAATAILDRLTLVSADPAFDGVLPRLW
ncbi:type II toxin-antitoxin system VapC family toxin [Methylocystis iwaonis]|uniref:Twitching motility protein PilT n=1 Tax=Methylocystis iwaonis TaxID=2885079 RepID=A0ABM8ECH7_9HYPH|nr:type II toxin-antitoxin system VapC family toxin [Methylocystis iwaonis]BDV35710.1 twitching motility protein PilT [Methylocystis iwaonis]